MGHLVCGLYRYPTDHKIGHSMIGAPNFCIVFSMTANENTPSTSVCCTYKMQRAPPTGALRPEILLHKDL